MHSFDYHHLYDTFVLKIIKHRMHTNFNIQFYELNGFTSFLLLKFGGKNIFHEGSLYYSKENH